MTTLLANAYLWVKAFHVIAMIAWMAGLFYLPRLFVYHAETTNSTEMDAVFCTMEAKLLRVIMTPAMMATWLLGLALVAIPGIVDWSALWPYAKGAGVFALTWFHMWCAGRRRDFAQGRNQLSGRHYRLMNEVPTLLVVLVVLSVIVRF